MFMGNHVHQANQGNHGLDIFPTSTVYKIN